MVSCITIYYDLSINTSIQWQSKSVDPAFSIAKIDDPSAYYVVSKTLLAPRNGSTILGKFPGWGIFIAREEVQLPHSSDTGSKYCPQLAIKGPFPGQLSVGTYGS